LICDCPSGEEWTDSNENQKHETDENWHISSLSLKNDHHSKKDEDGKRNDDCNRQRQEMNGGEIITSWEKVNEADNQKNLNQITESKLMSRHRRKGKTKITGLHRGYSRIDNSDLSFDYAVPHDEKINAVAMVDRSLILFADAVTSHVYMHQQKI
jgi:hypothetical protein